MTPGQSFALWLEKTTLENLGYQNNVVIAKEVDRLVGEGRSDLVALIGELVLHAKIDDTGLFMKARKAMV